MLYQPRSHLDLEALRTFVIAIELGSFTAAASFLYKTPSAISYRIKGLEDSLGIKLIERTTHSIAPTEAGKRLVAKAQEILELHQNFYDELEIIKTGIEPSFTLVFNNLLYDDVAAAKLLTHLSNKFHSAAFKVQKSVFTGVWDYMIYENGSFAIGAPSFHSIDEGFIASPLGLIEWILVCSTRHPIFKERKTINEETLRDFPAVNIQDSSIHTDGRPAWRLMGQEEILVPNLATKIHCHIEGLGIGFLPKPIAEACIERGALRELHAEGVGRQPSPMSYVRKKKDDGLIARYLENLISCKHDLIKPFLASLELGDQHERSPR